MAINLQAVREGYFNGGEANVRRQVVVDLIAKLNRGDTIDLQQASVLLYLAVDYATETGAMDSQIETGIRELFLSKKMGENTLAAFRKEWFNPYSPNLSGEELESAYTKLGGGALDGAGVQKLFAIAASQGEITHEEMAALNKVEDQAKLKGSAQELFAAEMLRLFIITLEKKGPDAEVTSTLVGDIIEMVGRHPDNERLLGVVEGLYFDGKIEKGSLSQFAEVFKKGHKLSGTEWQLVQGAVADGNGRIDGHGMLKLLMRIGIDDEVTPTEEKAIAALCKAPKSSEASEVLERWQRSGTPKRALGYARQVLDERGPALFGQGNSTEVWRAIKDSDDGFAIDRVVRAIAALHVLGVEQQGFKTPLRADEAQRMVDGVVAGLNDPNATEGKIVFDALKNQAGSALGAAMLLRKGGALAFASKVDLGDDAWSTQISNSQAFSMVYDNNTGEKILRHVDLTTGQTSNKAELPESMSSLMKAVEIDGTLYGVVEDSNSDDRGNPKCSLIQWKLQEGAQVDTHDLPVPVYAPGLLVDNGRPVVFGGTAVPGAGVPLPDDAVSTDVFTGAELPDVTAVTVTGDCREDQEISGVWLQLDIEHSCVWDLEFCLTSPDGKTSTVLPPEGGIDPEGWLFVPMEQCRGDNAKGEWRLEIEDKAGGDSGELHGWKLGFAELAEDGQDNPHGVFCLNDAGRWEKSGSLQHQLFNAVGTKLDDGKYLLVGSSPTDGSYDSQPGVVVFDPESGKETELPTIPFDGFFPSSTAVAGSTAYVCGNLADDETSILLSLNLKEIGDGWQQIEGGGELWLDGSTLHRTDELRMVVESGPQVDADSLLVGADHHQSIPNAADGARKVRLVRMAINELQGRRIADENDVVALLDMVEDLHRDGGLDEELRDSLNWLFNRLEMQGDASLEVASRWYGSELSGIDARGIIQALKLTNQESGLDASQRLGMIAKLAASKDVIGILLKLDLQGMFPAAESKVAQKHLAAAIDKKVEQLIAREALAVEDVELFVEDASLARARFPGLRRYLDESVKKLLLLGNHVDDSANPVRLYAHGGLNVSSLELRMALARFAKSGGRLDLPELRAVAAATDSDGERSELETSLLSRLEKMPLSGGVKEKLAVFLAGPTRSPDLAGKEALPIEGKVDGTGDLVVWANENKTASEGKVYHVGIDNEIIADSDGLKVATAHISGNTVLETAAGHEPYVDGATATSDNFDQVQVAWTANEVLRWIASMGIDLSALQKDTCNDGVLRIFANEFEDMNAYYSPPDNLVALGLTEDWHLASDADIVAHEIGHYILDHINPDMEYWGDAGGIHEGFADGLASLLFNDPEMSEDFGRHMGAREGLHLRNLENNLTLDDVDDEPHNRGEVFGAYIWSGKQLLSEIIGDDNQAARLMAQVMVKHAFYYTSTNPSAEDFLTGILAAAHKELASTLNDQQMEKFVKGLKAEGVKRKMVGDNWEPGPEATLVRTLRKNLAPRRATQLAHSSSSTPALLAALKASVGLRCPRGTKFELIKQVGSSDVQRVTFRASATDPESGQTLPVEDGYVTMVVDDGRVIRAGGRGSRMSKEIDWTPLPGGTQELATIAADQVRTFLQDCERLDSKLKDFVDKNAEKLLESAESQEVIYRNRRALKVKCTLGTFIVDFAEKEVIPKNLMFTQN